MGMSYLALRFAEKLSQLLINNGGVKMVDVKEFSRKNLLEAKKQFILENNNEEIEQAKKFLRLKQDEIDACDREMLKYNKRKNELLLELKVFG